MAAPRGSGAKMLSRDGETVGHIWYSRSHGGRFGALLEWGTDIEPVGPFVTEAMARREIELRANELYGEQG